MGAVTISPSGVLFIARFEGYRRYPYNDPADNATIGYGHLLHLGPVTRRDRLRYPLGLTVKQALAVLANDAAHAVAAVRTYARPTLTQTQFDALCSFAFNCGGGALAHSTLLLDVNARRNQRIEADFLRWDHAGGVVLPGLRARREAEAMLYLHGRY